MTTQRERLLPEWAPQDGVLLTWPHPGTDWRETLPAVEPVWVALAGHVARHERVLIAAHDAPLAARVRRLLAEAGVPAERVSVHVAPSDDTWARDHGPITVLGPGGPRLLDFVFNAWGGKFDCPRDDALTRALADAGAFAAPLTSHDLVLEGGALEIDDRGALLTTAACLLNPNRNPGLDRGAIEARLRALLGVSQIHWLHHGALAGDDTDSHIDTLARFAPDGSIVHVACDDPSDPHHAELSAMAAELAALRDADGRPYALRPLPWPAAVHDPDTGARLPATYANYLVINGAVLVPTYGDPVDAAALAIIGAAHPGREVVGVDCRAIIRQGGSLHCLTMQLPAGTLPPREESPR